MAERPEITQWLEHGKWFGINDPASCQSIAVCFPVSRVARSIHVAYHLKSFKVNPYLQFWPEYPVVKVGAYRNREDNAEKGSKFYIPGKVKKPLLEKGRASQNSQVCWVVLKYGPSQSEKVPLGEGEVYRKVTCPFLEGKIYYNDIVASTVCRYTALLSLGCYHNISWSKWLKQQVLVSQSSGSPHSKVLRGHSSRLAEGLVSSCVFTQPLPEECSWKSKPVRSLVSLLIRSLILLLTTTYSQDLI